MKESDMDFCMYLGRNSLYMYLSEGNMFRTEVVEKTRTYTFLVNFMVFEIINQKGGYANIYKLVLPHLTINNGIQNT
jgi:hypothetical protein